MGGGGGIAENVHTCSGYFLRMLACGKSIKDTKDCFQKGSGKTKKICIISVWQSRADKIKRNHKLSGCHKKAVLLCNLLAKLKYLVLLVVLVFLFNPGPM